MPWPEVFIVFLLSHLAGDFILQTDWQADRKKGGLGRDREARRALLSHTFTYTLAFLPALAWLAADVGANVLWAGVLVALPHLFQDDGRLLERYVREVKGPGGAASGSVMLAADQTLHLLALFGVALLLPG